MNFVKKMVGRNIAGYIIQRVIVLSDGAGFMFGENPNAPAPYVSWRFNPSDGEAFWGKYFLNFAEAITSHVVRISDHIASYTDDDGKPIRKLFDSDMRPEKSRVFIDMDGVLAVWNQVAALEDLYKEGYFLNLDPQMEVVEAAKALIADPEVEVFVLSAVLEDNPYAIPDKNGWLDKHLPELDAPHRLFASGSRSKASCVPGGVCPSDTLLDDYTTNLLGWSKFARGVKLLNGINHTNGTWKGAMVDKAAGAQEIVRTVKEEF